MFLIPKQIKIKLKIEPTKGVRMVLFYSIKGMSVSTISEFSTGLTDWRETYTRRFPVVDVG